MIKQLNGVDITIVERRDEFMYNELICSYISDYIGTKTRNNFLRVNSSDIEPISIIKFVSGGLQGKIKKLIVIQCPNLKAMECKLGDSKTYKGKIPSLFDELCRILPSYRNVKVIISTVEISKTSKVYKKVESVGKIVLYQPMGFRQYKSFVQKRCKLYNIVMESETIKYFLDTIDNNCAIIDSELQKLSLLDESLITRDIIRKNVMRSKGVIVFELINAIGARRHNMSIKLLSELLDQGIQPLQIIALLQRNFRILFHLYCKSDMVEFKLNKWSEKTYKEQMSKFTLDEIVSILKTLLNTEHCLKSSSMDGSFLLYMLIMEIV